MRHYERCREREEERMSCVSSEREDFNGRDMNLSEL
jgi:hypothetical protein